MSPKVRDKIKGTIIALGIAISSGLLTQIHVVESLVDVVVRVVE